MTIKQATKELARIMAIEASNSKKFDWVQTTAEGRSVQAHLYKVALPMLEEVIERYMKAI